MTASEPSTAVATQDAENALTVAEEVLSRNMPDAYRIAALFRKQEAMAAAQLGKTSWGMQLDTMTRRAMAAWGREHDIDPATEIDMLGGKIYVNSRYFYRKLAEMNAAGLVDYAWADHVNADARLDVMADADDAAAVREKYRRVSLRIEHNIPEAAPAAVVFRIKARAMASEVVGVKWCGLGKRNEKGNLVDPIGDAKPVETAISRAMRRAMLMLAERSRSSLADVVTATLHSVEVIQPTLAAAFDRVKSTDTGRRGVASLDMDEEVFGGSSRPQGGTPVVGTTSTADTPDDAALDREAAAESGDIERSE